MFYKILYTIIYILYTSQQPIHTVMVERSSSGDQIFASPYCNNCSCPLSKPTYLNDDVNSLKCVNTNQDAGCLLSERQAIPTIGAAALQQVPFRVELGTKRRCPLPGFFTVDRILVQSEQNEYIWLDKTNDDQIYSIENSQDTSFDIVALKSFPGRLMKVKAACHFGNNVDRPEDFCALFKFEGAITYQSTPSSSITLPTISSESSIPVSLQSQSVSSSVMISPIPSRTLITSSSLSSIAFQSSPFAAINLTSLTSTSTQLLSTLSLSQAQSTSSSTMSTKRLSSDSSYQKPMITSTDSLISQSQSSFSTTANIQTFPSTSLQHSIIPTSSLQHKTNSTTSLQRSILPTTALQHSITTTTFLQLNITTTPVLQHNITTTLTTFHHNYTATQTLQHTVTTMTTFPHNTSALQNSVSTTQRFSNKHSLIPTSIIVNSRSDNNSMNPSNSTTMLKPTSMKLKNNKSLSISLVQPSKTTIIQHTTTVISSQLPTQPTTNSKTTKQNPDAIRGDDEEELDEGLIIGLCVAVLILLILMWVLLLILYRRRKMKRYDTDSASHTLPNPHKNDQENMGMDTLGKPQRTSSVENPYVIPEQQKDKDSRYYNGDIPDSKESESPLIQKHASLATVDTSPYPNNPIVERGVDVGDDDDGDDYENVGDNITKQDDDGDNAHDVDNIDHSDLYASVSKELKNKADEEKGKENKGFEKENVEKDDMIFV